MDLSEEFDPAIPVVLPHEKVYLIQVGRKLFRLSGASLLSDAPSYFTSFFSKAENSEKVLFIDRNPTIFEKIYNHLQGYHINVLNDYEFVHLWLDSFYFGLKRLQKYLDNEDVFATIGGVSFKVPKALLMQSGNCPNYFLINFDSLLTDSRRIILQTGMIRPPPQRPVTASNRSPKLFADLVEILNGNSSVIGSDEHRKLLVKECRYYRFLELEQRILKHRILNNPFLGRTEIIMDLQDLLSKGIYNESTGFENDCPVHYARPYVTKEPKRSLIVQINTTADSEVRLVLNRTTQITAVVFTDKLAHMFRQVFKKTAKEFLEVIKNNQLTMICSLESSKAVINGLELKPDWFADFFNKLTEEPEPKKRKTSSKEGEIVVFRLCRSLWRVMVRGDRAMLHAVSLEGQTDQVFFNKCIEFL